MKVSKTITHTARLIGTGNLVAAFIDEVSLLEAKLGCLLVQLPPSLSFDARVASAFFQDLQSRTAVSIACEPRHESWFAKGPDELLRELEVAPVAADPAPVSTTSAPTAGTPGGARHFSYYRLHGSPKVYYSKYSAEFIRTLADRLREDAACRTVWCIFDNTTLGAATSNALELSAALSAV